MPGTLFATGFLAGRAGIYAPRLKYPASLPWHKEALQPEAYPYLMTLRTPLLYIRFVATLLAVLGLLASAPVSAAMSLAGPLMTVGICHDHQTLTIWLDAEENEHPAPHDCGDCNLCGFITPILPDVFAGVALQATAPPLAAKVSSELGTLHRDYPTAPLRGPPTHHNRIASA